MFRQSHLRWHFRKFEAQSSNVSFATFQSKETFELWASSLETAFGNVAPSGIGRTICTYVLYLYICIVLCFTCRVYMFNRLVCRVCILLMYTTHTLCIPCIYHTHIRIYILHIYTIARTIWGYRVLRKYIRSCILHMYTTHIHYTHHIYTTHIYYYIYYTYILLHVPYQCIGYW